MNKLISTVKENLAVYVLVPTLIGWFIQVLFLWNIGIPYIRFFSPSQVLSDWLLILWVLLAIYSGFISAKLFFKKIININLNSNVLIANIKSKSSGTIWKSKSLGLTVTLGSLVFCFYLLYGLYQSLLSFEFTIINLYLFPFIFAFTLEIISSIFSTLIETYWFQVYISNHPSTKDSVKLLIRLLIILTLPLSMGEGLPNLVMKFNSTFSFPINLSNSINLNKDPQNEIMYFNDKYIFIKNKTDSQITVKKFDDIFQK